MICDGIHDCLLSINFLHPQQHSFRIGHSCIKNLLTEVDRRTTIPDHKGKVNVIHLDLPNAFDRVSHICFINKFKRLGIKSTLIDCFNSYLKNDTLRLGLRSFFLRVCIVLVGSFRVLYYELFFLWSILTIICSRYNLIYPFSLMLWNSGDKCVTKRICWDFRSIWCNFKVEQMITDLTLALLSAK